MLRGSRRNVVGYSFRSAGLSLATLHQFAWHTNRSDSMLGAPFSTVVEVPVEQVTPMQPFLDKILTDS